jgi:hypothetical protein
MIAEEVASRVDAELNSRSTLESWHRITRDNVACFRVMPTRREFNDATADLRQSLWVVIDECSESQTDGYLVVFDEATGMFGLAAKGGLGQIGTFIGFYGNLIETLNSM